jgi:hypothetical protein
MSDGKYLMIAENLVAEIKGIRVDHAVLKAEVKRDIDQIRTTLDNYVYLNTSQAAYLNKAVKVRVRELLPLDGDYREHSKKMFSAIWRDLKDVYQVPGYREIPRIHFQNAVQYIADWQPIKLLKKTG